MKHLIAILVPFLLLGSQALAQNPEGIFTTQKEISCGPGPAILLGIKKYGEKPKIIFQNPVNNTQTLVFFNNETGSGTVVDVMPGNKIWCIISYGVNGWSENFGQKT